jgi:hypothetical protein
MHRCRCVRVGTAVSLTAGYIVADDHLDLGAEQFEWPTVAPPTPAERSLRTPRRAAQPHQARRHRHRRSPGDHRVKAPGQNRRRRPASSGNPRPARRRQPSTTRGFPGPGPSELLNSRKTGFDSFFCIPGPDGAHEKGGVEGEIGRFRRRHLVPVPSTVSLTALNQLIVAASHTKVSEDRPEPPTFCSVGTQIGHGLVRADSFH